MKTMVGNPSYQAEISATTEAALAEVIKQNGVEIVREHMTMILKRSNWYTWQATMNLIDRLDRRANANNKRP